MAEIVGIIVYFASPVFIAAFNNDPKVIAFGSERGTYHYSVLFSACLFPLHCRTYAWSWKSYGAHVCYAGLLVRDPCDLYTIAVKLHPVIQTVFWAYPLTWSLSSILFLIFYLKSDWIHGFEKKRN